MSNYEKHIAWLIINPISGVKHKNLEKFKALIENSLHLDHYLPEFQITQYRGHASEIAARGLEAGVKYFFVAGGDGTVNEVASVLANTEAVLAILPSGSGNGLAHHLEIPVRTEAAISVINKKNVLAIDTCMVNDAFFVSIAGIGFDARVARQFAKSRRRGFTSYARIVFKEYFSYKSKEYILSLDGEEKKITAFFISFANSSQFGYNTRIAPQASLTDGLIDVCIVTKPPLKALPWITHLLMRRKIDTSGYLEIMQVSNIHVQREKGRTVNVDGEAIRMKKELNISIRPSSLKVLVP